jgi:hypothetical protein
MFRNETFAVEAWRSNVDDGKWMPIEHEAQKLVSFRNIHPAVGAGIELKRVV